MAQRRWSVVLSAIVCEMASSSAFRGSRLSVFGMRVCNWCLVNGGVILGDHIRVTMVTRHVSA